MKATDPIGKASSPEKRFVTEVENVTEVLQEHPDEQSKGNGPEDPFGSSLARDGNEDVESKAEGRKDRDTGNP